MNTTPTIVALIAALGALVLAVSSFRGHKLSVRNKVWMALTWIGIIGGLVVVLTWLGA